MAKLLDRLLLYDGAGLDLRETVELFRSLTQFPFDVFQFLPDHYRRDRLRLDRSGLLSTKGNHATRD